MIVAFFVKMGWLFEVWGKGCGCCNGGGNGNAYCWGKVGYTLAGIDAYSMHKECRVDIVIDTKGTKVLRLGDERYSHKDSLSTLFSKVKSEVVARAMGNNMDESSMVDTGENPAC